MRPKDTFFSKKRSINIGGTLHFWNEPIVMAILNSTPDSFYAQSRVNTQTDILKQAEKALTEGAAIIDLGAYSSRPGADDVSEQSEKERLTTALSVLRKEFPNAIISIDTFRSNIAQWSVNEYGVNIINDISGGNLDPLMHQTVAALNVPYILMHMRGTPLDMQQNPVYQNVTREVITELSVNIRKLNSCGVNDVIIDPGFGFSKTVEHNYQILEKLNLFQMFELPLLVGISRKSMIYKVLETTPEEALNGTTVLNTIALLKGADILRVHDVKQAIEAVKLVKMLPK